MKYCKNCKIKLDCIHYDDTRNQRCIFEIKIEKDLKYLKKIYNKEVCKNE